MKRVNRTVFVGIREPSNPAPHNLLYAKCLYWADESELTKVVTKG